MHTNCMHFYIFCDIIEIGENMNYTIQGNVLKVNESIKKVEYSTFDDIPENITEVILPEGLEKN